MTITDIPPAMPSPEAAGPVPAGSMTQPVEAADRATFIGVAVVAVAVDVAVRNGVDGIGGTLAVVAVAGALAASRRLRNPRAWPLLVLAPLFGAGLVLRAAEWILFLDVVAAAGVLVLSASLARRGDPLDLSIPHLVGRALHAGVHAVLAPGFVLRGGTRSEQPAATAPLAVIRGALLAAPVLAVVALLLRSADPVFASFFRLPADLGDLSAHLVVLAVGAWGAAALLRLASAAPYDLELTGRRSLGAVEARIVLGGLVALFVAFTGSQVVTVLGGADYVRRTSGLSYSDYARSGFFQLLAVAAITLATLLLLRSSVRHHDRWFTALSLTAVVLTLVLVAGALRRLGLYEQAYGLTLLRLWAVLFALWLGGVFVLLGFSLAGAHRERAWFVPSAISLGLVGLLILNVANPEAWIVRRNVERFAGTDRFDTSLPVELSDDAVPALVDALDRMPEDDAAVLRDRLCAAPSGRTDGFFSFNLAEDAASDARRRACPPLSA